jgi:trehalose-6-phosphate synthase
VATMAERVRTHDVHRWVTDQLTEIAARGSAREPAASRKARA